VEAEPMYELVVDAVRRALAEEHGGADVRIHRRMAAGEVLFRDDEGKVVKAVPGSVFFKKVTSIREKLRVMEQKINNHPAMSDEDKAELQVYISRCYGSLTTFNFLFREEEDKFKGTGG
jgi:hypothetical protein